MRLGLRGRELLPKLNKYMPEICLSLTPIQGLLDETSPTSCIKSLNDDDRRVKVGSQETYFRPSEWKFGEVND